MEGMGQAVPGKPIIMDIGANAGYYFSFLAASSGQRDEITVETLTLRDIWADFGIERWDLLNMGCDGAEYGILYGCSPEDLGRIDQIAMEVHSGPKEDENIDALETFPRKSSLKTRRRSVGMLWAWREGR